MSRVYHCDLSSSSDERVASKRRRRGGGADDSQLSFPSETQPDEETTAASPNAAASLAAASSAKNQTNRQSKIRYRTNVIAGASLASRVDQTRRFQTPAFSNQTTTTSRSTTTPWTSSSTRHHHHQNSNPQTQRRRRPQANRNSSSLAKTPTTTSSTDTGTVVFEVNSRRRKEGRRRRDSSSATTATPAMETARKRYDSAPRTCTNPQDTKQQSRSGRRDHRNCKLPVLLAQSSAKDTTGTCPAAVGNHQSCSSDKRKKKKHRLLDQKNTAQTAKADNANNQKENEKPKKHEHMDSGNPPLEKKNKKKSKGVIPSTTKATDRQNRPKKKQELPPDGSHCSREKKPRRNSKTPEKQPGPFLEDTKDEEERSTWTKTPNSKNKSPHQRDTIAPPAGITKSKHDSDSGDSTDDGDDSLVVVKNRQAFAGKDRDIPTLQDNKVLSKHTIDSKRPMSRKPQQVATSNVEKPTKSDKVVVVLNDVVHDFSSTDGDDDSLVIVENGRLSETRDTSDAEVNHTEHCTKVRKSTNTANRTKARRKSAQHSSKHKNPPANKSSAKPRRQKDILKAGDRIAYYHPAFVAGNPMGYRETKILAVQQIPLNPNSQIDYYPLELENAEVLPSDARVKRLVTGREKPIEDFVLIPTFKHNIKHITGVQIQAHRMARILAETRRAFEEMPEHLQDLNQFRGLNTSSSSDDSSSSSETKTEFERQQARMLDKKQTEVVNILDESISLSSSEEEEFGKKPLALALRPSKNEGCTSKLMLMFDDDYDCSSSSSTDDDDTAPRYSQFVKRMAPPSAQSRYRSTGLASVDRNGNLRRSEHPTLLPTPPSSASSKHPRSSSIFSLLHNPPDPPSGHSSPESLKPTEIQVQEAGGRGPNGDGPHSPALARSRGPENSCALMSASKCIWDAGDSDGQDDDILSSKERVEVMQLESETARGNRSTAPALKSASPSGSLYTRPHAPGHSTESSPDIPGHNPINHKQQASKSTGLSDTDDDSLLDDCLLQPIFKYQKTHSLPGVVEGSTAGFLASRQTSDSPESDSAGSFPRKLSRKSQRGTFSSSKRGQVTRHDTCDFPPKIKEMEDKLWDFDSGSEDKYDSSSTSDDEHQLESKTSHVHAASALTLDICDSSDDEALTARMKKRKKSSFGVKIEARRRLKGVPCTVRARDIDSYALDGADSEDDDISRTGALGSHRKSNRTKHKRKHAPKESCVLQPKQQGQTSSVFQPDGIENQEDHVYGGMDSSSDEEHMVNGKRPPLYGLSRQIKGTHSMDSSIHTKSRPSDSQSTNSGFLHTVSAKQISSSAKGPLQRLAAIRSKEKKRQSISSHKSKPGGILQLELKKLSRSSDIYDELY